VGTHIFFPFSIYISKLELAPITTYLLILSKAGQTRIAMTIYWLIGIVGGSFLVGYTTNRHRLGYLTFIGLLIGWWFLAPGYSAPKSSAPSFARHFDNGVWIAVDEKTGRFIPKDRIGATIAYGENNLTDGCQRQLGIQLLQFSKIMSVVPYLETAPSCESMPIEFRRIYRKVDLMTRLQGSDCRSDAFDYFQRGAGQLACVKLQEGYTRQFDGWRVFLNCAQSRQEYQLRVLGPNLFTGGSLLNTFAGVNFSSGGCLDSGHRRLIEDLLDVVDLGSGRRDYSSSKK
jgi:hypothetical protein